MDITCILIDDEPLARETLEEYIAKVPYLQLVGSFSHPLEAVKIINSQAVNLIFSDIEMPEMDGISFFKSLKNPPFVIFITAHPGFAIEGFELDILDYILKPFSFERFLKATNKALKAIESNEKGSLRQDYFTIADGHKTVLIRYSDVFYIQGYEDYIKINTSEKEHLIRKRMKTITQYLPSEQFVRIHKSYIVNVSFIKNIDATKVTLTVSNITLPLGLQYRDDFYQKLGINKLNKL